MYINISITNYNIIKRILCVATRQSSRVIYRKVCRSDLIPWMHGRHKTGKLEKACKNYKVRTRMIAVHMVRLLNMSVEETADILVRCPTRVRDRLRRYDEGGLEEHDR